MKNYPKFLMPVIAVLCILCLYFGIVGIQLHYGDVTTTVAPGIASASGGLGFETGAEIVLTYDGEDELTDEDCKEVVSVLESRLFKYGISDYSVSYDLSAKAFLVELSYSSMSSYDMETVVENLGTIGKIEIRAGNETDDDGNPTGLSETVIATNEGLIDVETSQTTGALNTILNNMTLTFTGDAKKAIREYSESVQDAENKLYSVWIDGEKVSYHSFSSVVKDGKIAAGDLTYAFGSSGTDYSPYLLSLAAGPLPFELTSSGIYNYSNAGDNECYVALMYTVVILVLAFAVDQIWRAKLIGAAELLAGIGYLGLMTIFTTGYFYSSFGFQVTAYAASGVLVGLISVIILGYCIMEEIKASLAVSTPFKAIDAGFKPHMRKWPVFVIAPYAVSFIARLIFKNSEQLHGLYELFHAFAVSEILGYLTIICLGCLFAKSFAAFKKLGSIEFLFGGKKEQ